MLASDIYDLSCCAYNGSDEARGEWFAIMAPLARAAGAPYGVLPSLIMAKAATESGYGSGLYDRTLEKRFNVKLAGKAQKHNNILSINDFSGNRLYLRSLPLPRWISDPRTFEDYGPHYQDGKLILAKESWKDFSSVEDCLQDWSANMRGQAAKHDRPWGSTIEEQLIAIESFTPEGAPARRPGMHYAWQDDILDLYDKFDLGRYDSPAAGETEGLMKKITTKDMDAHISAAYDFANRYCHYGPSNSAFPAMSDGWADCASLILRALAELGVVDGPLNINQVVEACRSAGMTISSDPMDAVRHHAVAFVQDKHVVGTDAISHVFYSLGGSDENRIDKYDLGSEKRIRAEQPFVGVPLNEWVARGRVISIVAYYKDDPDPLPDYEDESLTGGTIKKTVGIYAGPSTGYKRIVRAKAGTPVIYGPSVSNGHGRYWRHCRVGDTWGWVYYSAVTPCPGLPKTYKAKIVKLSDGYAAVRAGAGTSCPEVGRIPSGKIVRVVGSAVDPGGAKWLCIRRTDLRGYIVADLATRI